MTRLEHILRAGLTALALVTGCGSEPEPAVGLPACPATNGLCAFTWSGASSGTLPCTVTLTEPGAFPAWVLVLDDLLVPPVPYVQARLELKAAPVAGSVIREGDLANVTASTIGLLEDWDLHWGVYREANPSSRQGDFALYFESVNGTEVHGHLSALLENSYGAPGTVVRLCATF
jgi:hypothetical protein